MFFPAYTFSLELRVDLYPRIIQDAGVVSESLGIELCRELLHAIYDMRSCIRSRKIWSSGKGSGKRNHKKSDHSITILSLSLIFGHFDSKVRDVISVLL